MTWSRRYAVRPWVTQHKTRPIHHRSSALRRHVGVAGMGARWWCAVSKRNWGYESASRIPTIARGFRVPRVAFVPRQCSELVNVVFVLDTACVRERNARAKWYGVIGVTSWWRSRSFRPSNSATRTCRVVWNLRINIHSWEESRSVNPDPSLAKDNETRLSECLRYRVLSCPHQGAIFDRSNERRDSSRRET